jgi:hypothetical protein
MAAPRLCSKCRTAGHNSRSCKAKAEKAANDGGIVADAPAARVKLEPIKVEPVSSDSPILPWEVRFSAFANINGKRHLICGSRWIEVSDDVTFKDIPKILGF